MSETITFETHHGGQWHPTATLAVHQPERGRDSSTRLSYLDDYIDAQLDGFGKRDGRAIAEDYPIGFGVWSHDGWPAFLYDIVPSGAARRWWGSRLGADARTERDLDWLLLRNHTVAPIGNLRVATATIDRAPRPFERDEVLRRDSEFLSYAQEQGAAIGGATGAGGDAPKVLLVEDADSNLYPAGTLTDDQIRACWLVKWPRGTDSDDDRTVLRTEHLYATTLAELGLPTAAGVLHDDGEVKPSLWLPRFDRTIDHDGVTRLAIESMYSLAGVAGMGAVVTHQRFLNALRNALERREQTSDLTELAREYLRRELLDRLLGNSDNHGRNRAFVRGDRLRWTPIYDLAPMVLDPAGVTRTTTWADHEYGGQIDWPAVCKELDDWLPGLEARDTLCAFGQQLLELPEALAGRGLADRVHSHPRIHIADMAETLKSWGLA